MYARKKLSGGSCASTGGISVRDCEYFFQEKQLCEENDLLKVILNLFSFGSKKDSNTESLRNSVRMYSEKMLGFSWHQEGMTEKVMNLLI